MTTALIKAQIQVMPRDVILDTQGRAVENSLKMHGYKIDNCRIGKLIEISFSGISQSEAESRVHQMVKEAGLYNPLIEKYEIQWH